MLREHGGIINIILKKNNARGINANITLSGGTRLENGSFNLNAGKTSLVLMVFLVERTITINHT